MGKAKRPAARLGQNTMDDNGLQESARIRKLLLRSRLNGLSLPKPVLFQLAVALELKGPFQPALKYLNVWVFLGVASAQPLQLRANLLGVHAAGRGRGNRYGDQ